MLKVHELVKNKDVRCWIEEFEDEYLPGEGLTFPATSNFLGELETFVKTDPYDRNYHDGYIGYINKEFKWMKIRATSSKGF